MQPKGRKAQRSGRGFNLALLSCIFWQFSLSSCQEGYLYNPANPGNEEFHLTNVLHCLLSDPLCPGGISLGGGGVISCPPEYIPVPPNPAVGTNAPFCVAKYEMKDMGGSPVSTPNNTPWVNINQTTARTECGSSGPGYHLITNPEWMTIARNIETVTMNWSGGLVGSGALNAGHTDNAPANSCDSLVENVAGPCTVAGPGGWDSQKRTHLLSNGRIIWDFAGNVWEWVDWNVTPANKAYSSGDGGVLAAFIEFSSLDTNIGAGQEMETITWQTANPAFNSAQGVGQYYGGDNATGGAATRGGDYSTGTTSAGVFALSVGLDPSSAGLLYGFRCAYAP